MRILVASKFWYLRSGAERVIFEEIEALEAAGHTVAHFSTTHPDNDASPYSAFFAPYIELGDGGAHLPVRERALAVVRMFYNREAARRFGRLMDEFVPDLVHAHVINRQLSPSILAVAHGRGVPVVQTLHDMHKICPEDRLLRAGEFACVPPLCRSGHYGPAIANRCSHGSAAVSALAAAELAYQRARGVYDRCIARYISPSRFLADRMHEGGWNVTPIDVIPNPVRPGVAVESPSRDYFLYAGRLAVGKGIDVLLEAAAVAGVRVIVAGEGPLGDTLRSSFPGVEFVGRRAPDEVASLLASARGAVLPSTCVENAPLGVLEAMAAGVPVIATSVGGIPEMFEDGREGLLVPPGDVAALASALRALAGDDDAAARIGAAARERAGAEYGMERHLQRLLRTYESAIGAML